MPVKYRKLFWPTILLIAVTSTALALVSVRTRTGAISIAERKDAAKPAEPPKPSEVSVTKVTASSPTSQFIQGDLLNQSIEAELITILPSGLEPTQITRPQGPFLLAVENRSGLKEVDFQLSVDGGARVFRVKRDWERLDWNQIVDPPPGRYVLTETNHPGWTCTITITAQ